MKSKTIVSVRSNCNFALNYESGKLVPTTELIIITTEPKYELNKKGDALIKTQHVSEFRCQTDLEGVNRLIGELQILVKNCNAFEQTSHAINALIKDHKPA